MKIAILGASGFLASNLAFFLGKKSGMSLVGVSRKRSDLFPQWVQYSTPEKLVRMLETLGVSHLINCAAVTSHERAAEDPRGARMVNASLAQQLAEVASKTQIQFCQISTDAVYSGKSGKLYAEEDRASPQSIYGATKLLGEQLVRKSYPAALIVRTNFFGWSPSGDKGVLDFFYRRLNDRQETIGFDDYKVSSMYVGHLAEILRNLMMMSQTGIYNVASANPLSKFDFGVSVAKIFDLDVNTLVRGSVLKDSNLSRRGLDLGLGTEKVTALLGIPMPSTLEGIERARSDQKEIFSWFGRRT